MDPTRSRIRDDLGLRPEHLAALVVSCDRQLTGAVWGVLIARQVIYDLVILIPMADRATRHLHRLAWASGNGAGVRAVGGQEVGLAAADLLVFLDDVIDDPPISTNLASVSVVCTTAGAGLIRRHGPRAIIICDATAPNRVAAAIVQAIDQIRGANPAQAVHRAAAGGLPKR